MATVLGSRNHLDEAAKLASFKQRRLAKKIADRERLEAEFPLIFGTKQNAAASTNKYTTKISASTPNKRKISAINDENSMNAANSCVRKTSSILSSAKKAPKSAVAFSSTLPLPPAKRSSSIPTKKTAKPLDLKPVEDTHPLITSEVLSEAAVEPSVPAIEMIPFSEPIMVVEEPIMVPEVPEVEEAVEEKVQDVLDYLLECNEVDETTHRRLSKQSFSKSELRRLSVGPKKRVSFAACTFAPETAAAEPAVAPETSPTEGVAVPNEAMEGVEATTGDAMVPKESVEGVAGEYIGEMDSFYAPVDEECEIEDMDILFALRNYINTLDPSPIKPCLQAVEAPVVCDFDSLPMAEYAVPEYFSFENALRKSSRNGRKSAKFSRQLSTESALGADETGLHVVKDKEGDGEAEGEGEGEGLADAANEDKAEEADGVITTKQVSFASNDATATPAVATKPANVITYPRTETIQHALQQGIVTAEVFGYLPNQQHIQYMINVAIPASTATITCLASPNSDDTAAGQDTVKAFPAMKMFLLKRFSEFKEFRQELCSVIAPAFPGTTTEDEVMEVIPSLKNKSSAAFQKRQSMSEDEKHDLYSSRQEMLSTWFKTILSNQKMMQNPEYRTKIQEFFSC